MKELILVVVLVVLFFCCSSCSDPIVTIRNTKHELTKYTIDDNFIYVTSEIDVHVIVTFDNEVKTFYCHRERKIDRVGQKVIKVSFRRL